jgi:hypothetical protein
MKNNLAVWIWIWIFCAVIPATITNVYFIRIEVQELKARILILERKLGNH